MADIKISELGASSAVNSTDIFPMTSSGVTVKATAQQIKNYMGVGNLTDLNTTDKSSTVAAINEVNTKLSKTEVLISNSGDAYDPTRPYKVGELCIYNNTLYRCITACSAGSWATNQSCFTQDTLTNVTNHKVNNFGNVDGFTKTYLNNIGNTIEAKSGSSPCRIIISEWPNGENGNIVSMWVQYIPNEGNRLYVKNFDGAVRSVKLTEN